VSLGLLIPKTRGEIGLVFRRSRSRRRCGSRGRGGRRSRSRGHRGRCTAARSRRTATDGGAASLLAAAIDDVVTALTQSLLRVTTDGAIAVRQRAGQGRCDFAVAAAGVLLELVTELLGRLASDVLVGVVQAVHHRAQDFRIALAIVRTQLVDRVGALTAVASRLRPIDQVCNFAGIGTANLRRRARGLVADALVVMEHVEQAVRPTTVAVVARIAGVAARSGRNAAARRSRAAILRRTSRRSTA